MNLIERLSNFRLNRKVAKRIKLDVKLQDLKKDYEKMNNRLIGSHLRLDFVHKCWEERISILENKIEKIDRQIEKEFICE